MSYKKTYTVAEAKKMLERYCSYQERSHKEVEAKLSALKMISEAKEIIILHLLEHDFLNEERFAKTFARGKFKNNKWGKLKITQALKFKNISTYNIKKALEEIDDTAYFNLATTLAKKKLLSIKGNSFQKKQKVINYLLSKGFEYNIIKDILNN